MRAVGYGVVAYALSWVYVPFFYLLIDLSRPFPLINVV